MQIQLVSNIIAFFLLAGCNTVNCNSSDGYEALYRAVNPYRFGYFYSYDYPFGYADQLKNKRKGRSRLYRYQSPKKDWYNFGNDRLQVYRPDRNYRHMHPRKNYGEHRNSPVFRNRYTPGHLLDGRFSYRRRY